MLWAASVKSVKLVDNCTSNLQKGLQEGLVSGLYLAKRGGDEITSSFVATKKNLIPSNSLTHTGGGMGSVGSEFISSFTDNPILIVWIGEGTVSEYTHGTTVSRLL